MIVKMQSAKIESHGSHALSKSKERKKEGNFDHGSL